MKYTEIGSYLTAKSCTRFSFYTQSFPGIINDNDYGSVWTHTRNDDSSFRSSRLTENTLKCLCLNYFGERKNTHKLLSMVRKDL